ncbi:ATP synthase F1 subunit gamma [Hugenholtzia roseola]|uniref:ATP synthase F1 subunit gamma n=1 Tax=Hugenholtzia roseola TaxID=1002 RepID=UPI000478747F|nr:ATP synthase F1 subunit gamma [Hugenholtzia roseola]
MPSLKEVRNRISSVKSTQQITKAMKMVAAAKLRRAQNKIVQMRPYAQKLTQILQNVTSSLVGDDFNNAYSQARTPEKILLVVITSDKGLCGAFNTNVTRAVNLLLNDTYRSQHAKGNVTLLCVGKKGYEYFKRRNVPLISDYSTILTAKDLGFGDVLPAAEFAMKGFLDKKYDKVVLVYNEFKNAATQILQTETLLPIQIVKEDAPAASQTSKSKDKQLQSDYVFEPNKEEILESLIPQTLKIQFYKSVLESNASEQGSRMTAMDKATENAGELLKELKLSYNRARQANITKEILEIVGGAEALGK